MSEVNVVELGQDKHLRMSDEGLFLAASAVDKLPRDGRETVVIETRHRKVLMRAECVVVRVKPYGRAHEYWADVATGSLYPLVGGHCLSTSRRRIVRGKAAR